MIIERLDEKIPESDTKDLKEVTADKVANEYESDKYASLTDKIAKDISWLSEIKDEAQREKWKAKYMECMALYDAEEPSITKILESKLTDADKKDLLVKYKIYRDEIGNPFDVLTTRREIVKVLKVAENLDTDTREFISNEETRLQIKIDKEYDPKTQILTLNAPDKIKMALLDIYKEMTLFSDDSDSYSHFRELLSWATSLPYNATIGLQPGNLTNGEYISMIKSKLDKELYGMEPIKEGLLHVLNDWLTNPGSIGSIALCGEPGLGKTSIAKAFATATGRPFERIGLGGMKDGSDLAGSNSHWLGSGPGIIVRILKQMKCSDGIIFLDELDKTGDDIQNLLLHITDFTQNSEYRDKYLSMITIDLSKIWWVFAFNHRAGINPVLLDRLNVLDLQKYSSPELREIMINYIFPKALKNINMEPSQLMLSVDATKRLIDIFQEELEYKGVRCLERAIRTLCSKINLLKTTQNSSITLGYSIPDLSFPYTITAKTIDILLAKPAGGSDIPFYIM